MSQTRVVHCCKEPFDAYIGRSMPRYPDLRASGWGNPFRPARGDSDAGSAIARYRTWLMGQPQLLARLPELRGKTLGCWCAPLGGLTGDLAGRICHGQVLAALADALPDDPDNADDADDADNVEERGEGAAAMPVMKCVSLWQPYATLMAAGYKRIETRAWSPRSLRPGQLVAIHAAKHWTAAEREMITNDPFFRRYLQLAQRRGLWSARYPPLGGVVAIARFERAEPTETLRPHISDTERAFGAYAPGRYGWVFSEVRPVAIIPARGMQGIFEWDAPREIAALYQEPVNRSTSILSIICVG